MLPSQTKTPAVYFLVNYMSLWHKSKMNNCFQLFLFMLMFSCSIKVEQPNVHEMVEKYFKNFHKHTSRFQVNKIDAVDTAMMANKIYFITYSVDYQDSLDVAHSIVITHAEIKYYPGDSTFELVRDYSDWK